jgi:hypothetical protein
LVRNCLRDFDIAHSKPPKETAGPSTTLRSGRDDSSFWILDVVDQPQLSSWILGRW